VPSIMVVADIDAGDASGFVLKERVSAPLLDDPHFSSQLRRGRGRGDAPRSCAPRRESIRS
jgi:hypothetical protein